MSRPRIMVAPNGARRGPADYPALPVTLPQIAATAVACHAAGAQAMHLHVRDAAGRQSLDPGRYRETLAEIARRVPDLRVQITTEAAGLFDVAAQHRCLTALRPAWASVSVREIARDPALAPRLYADCAAQGTELQHILYSTEDIALLADWRARGIVRTGQDAVLYVLGRYGADSATRTGDLDPFLGADPGRKDWMVCAFGPTEHACLLHAARRGGSLRVGFENSLCDAEGTPHRDNAASVAALVARLEGSGP